MPGGEGCRTCRGLIQFQVSCRHSPFASAGLYGTFCQQDLPFVLHYAANDLNVTAAT